MDHHSWLSWHLHLRSADRSVGDRVITDVVGPAVDPLPDGSWFFIRYWQGGPHIRLRVRRLAGADAARLHRSLEDRLGTAGRLAPGEVPLDHVELGVRAARLAAAGEGGVPLVAEAPREPGTHPAAYHAEYERYGGPRLLPVSEALFATSSALCLAFLRRHPPAAARTALALRATAAAAVALEDPAQEDPDLAGHGLASWRDWALRFGHPPGELDRLVADWADAAAKLARTGRDPLRDLRADLPPDDPMAPWQQGLRQAVRTWRETSPLPAARLVLSHVHMLHNRLGLSVTEEMRSYALLTPPTNTPATAARTP